MLRRPPNRRRLNRPTPSKRVANVPTSSPRAELHKRLEHKPIGRVPDDSDDSDKLVTANRTNRNRRGIKRRDIYASGGVAAGDTPAAHRLRSHDIEGPKSPYRAGLAAQGSGQGTLETNPQPLMRSAVLRKDSANTGSIPRKSLSGVAPTIANTSSFVGRAQGTPGGETSILGTIKPRKRQQSILRLIDNNESSNLTADDEDDFLPNDESTPLKLSTALASAASSGPLDPQSPPSRKRKLSPPSVLVPSSQQSISLQRNDIAATKASQTSKTVPSLQQPSRTKPTQRPAPTAVEDADIMALPQSSSSPSNSPVSSPAKTSKSRAARNPPPISTSALQALMPARRRRTARQRTRNEFDIPADSSSEGDRQDQQGIVSDDDSTPFTLGSRSRNVGSKNTAKSASRPSKQSGAVKAKAKGKATIRAIQSTRSPAKPVTPLKRASSQPHGQNGETTGLRDSKAQATYSSRRPRGTSTKAGGGDGKENQPDDSYNGRSLEESIEEAEDTPPEEEAKARPPVTAELQQVAAKFREIDDWDLVFEDDTLGDLPSSSPRRR
jgi:hypothetical protein